MSQTKLSLDSPLKTVIHDSSGHGDAQTQSTLNRYAGSGLIVVLCGLLLVIEFVQWLGHIPASVMIGVSAALLLTAMAFYLPRMLGERREVKRLQVARDGAQAVAEGLQLVEDDGHHIFQGIVGPDFTVDHVIVGAKGVFTVQTNTFMEQAGRDNQLRFDGERVRTNGVDLAGEPVSQAQAQAQWFKKTLFDSTSKMFAVKPVLVFPGWSLSANTEATSDIWALEPSALQASLRSEPERLSEEDVKLIVFHLKRYISTSA